MARLLSFAFASIACFVLTSALADAQDRFTKFRDDFDAARKLGIDSKLDELLGDHEEEATHWIVDHAELLDRAPNEVLYERFDALRTTWKRVYESDFPDIMERYFAYADSNAKKERLRIYTRYQNVRKSQLSAQAEKDTARLTLVGDEYAELGKAFDAVGDKFYASQAYLGEATSLEETYFGKRADLHRVARAYQKALARREEIELKDRFYREVGPRLKSLEGLGFGGGGASGEGGGAGGDEVPVSGPELRGPSATVQLTYERLKDMQKADRPSYYVDMHHQIWPAIRLGTVSSSAGFDRVESSPRVIREGSSKALIDTDGDGKGDQVWPTRGRLEVVEIELGSGASKRTWSVLSDIGRQQDFYQGQQLNLEPLDSSWLLYYAPAGSMVGEVGGESIAIVDDNMDGIYGSPPQSIYNVGLTPEVAELEFDSIRVGRAKLAMPWSEYAQIGKAGWHRLESLDGGTRLTAQPVSFKTGTLRLKTKGVKPDYFVIRGLGPDFENTYINVAGGKKVEVPAGRWEFVWGLLRSGKKMQMMKAVMVPTEQMGVYDVREGEDAEIEVGAPFSFDFAAEATADGVRVEGTSVRVIDASGAAYERIYQAVPQPEASVRKKGSRRASASEVMRPAQSQDEIENHGWGAMWKPLSEEMTLAFEEFEVQLAEAKNKLFGKIESAWK
ncbi:MAG: hypothetical protein AAF726_07425 [Planctomycetota bacterium]